MREKMHMKKLLPFLIIPALFLLFGCTASDSSYPDKSDPQVRPPKTLFSSSVNLSVANDGKNFTAYKIDCSVEENFCGALIDTEGLAPIEKNTPCTMLYAGPEKINVSGIVGDVKVDYSFSKNNGCEINRWEIFTTVLDKLNETPIILDREAKQDQKYEAGH